MATTNKIIIGRTDVADFLTLGLHDIDIKIDTGAYTSSIHCMDISKKDDTLLCKFLDPTKKNYNGKIVAFKDFDVAFVKSSNGIVSERYAIKTEIVLFEKNYPITLTLNDRNDMRFPVLIGRKFLTKKFIVDTEFINLSHDKKN